jgi:hypothetical protein
MVDFRFIAVVAITSLVFLLGIFLGQAISYYNLSELRQSQEKILSEMMGYDLSWSILAKEDICNLSFKEFFKKRQELGNMVYDLEKKFGPKNPEVLIEKERYHIHQIREYLFFRDLKEKCNLSYPLIIYFYSHPCDECIAQGYVLDTLSRKYNLTTIYSLDYDISNPILDTIKILHNVTTTPALIINGKTYNKFLKIGEIEKIILIKNDE